MELYCGWSRERRIKVPKEIGWKGNNVVDVLVQPHKEGTRCRSLVTSCVLRSEGLQGGTAHQKDFVN